VTRPDTESRLRHIKNSTASVSPPAIRRAASQGRSRTAKIQRIRTTIAIAMIAATTFLRSGPCTLALNMDLNMR
jgi:hypothetical protein